MTEDKMIGIRLTRIVLREDSPQQWLHLQEIDGERSFPIVIALHEASEIRRVLHGESTPRPLTHELMYDVIASLGCEIKSVEIVGLRENTFFAEICMVNAEGEQMRIDARPSDALALGLRAAAKVWVAESVLEQVRTDKGGGEPDPLPDPLPDP